MSQAPEATYTAFAGDEHLVSGALDQVLTRIKRRLDREPEARVLVFDDDSGAQVDFDLRGSLADVLARHATPADAPAAARGPGRPRLGVVAREVTLLPRHWQWLEQQPRGISATLRQLVEDARRNEPSTARARRARDGIARFLTAMAGDRPGYEDATRALYAGDHQRLTTLIRPWPAGLRKHVGRLVNRALAFEGRTAALPE